MAARKEIHNSPAFSINGNESEPDMFIDIWLRSRAIDDIISKMAEPGRPISLEEYRTVLGWLQDDAAWTKKNWKEADTNDILDNNLKLYLNDLLQHRLLTPQEEVQLAKAYHHGKSALKKFETEAPPKIARSEHVEKRLSFVSDNETNLKAKIAYFSRKRVTQANLGLVVSVAKKCIDTGVPFIDLIQEGNMILAHALDKFDWKKNNKFSTYAMHWIRHSIGRAVEGKGKIIRLPPNAHAIIRSYRTKAIELLESLGKPPSIEEVAKAMNEDPVKLKKIFQASDALISLETPVGEKGEDQLSDTIPDSGNVPLEVRAEQRELHKIIFKIIESGRYAAREREALILRFGLSRNGENSYPHTLEEIGRELGLTRERARQILEGALKKMSGEAEILDFKNA